MNGDLAEILVMNLLKNAIVHNTAGGVVTVTIAGSWFSIENSGNPEPLDEEKMFDRFYKRSPKAALPGLGLLLLKQLPLYTLYLLTMNSIIVNINL